MVGPENFEVCPLAEPWHHGRDRIYSWEPQGFPAQHQPLEKHIPRLKPLKMAHQMHMHQHIERLISESINLSKIAWKRLRNIYFCFSKMVSVLLKKKKRCSHKDSTQIWIILYYFPVVQGWRSGVDLSNLLRPISFEKAYSKNTIMHSLKHHHASISE